MNKLICYIALAMTAFSCSESEFAIHQESVKLIGFQNQKVEVKGNSSVFLFGNPDQVLAGSTISLDHDSWLFLENISFEQLRDADLLQKIKINDQPLEDGVNADVLRYYNGVYVKPMMQDDFFALSLSSSTVASQPQLGLDQTVVGEQIVIGDNQLKSFTLKRGHLLVLAENEDGSGARQSYIATDKDLIVDLDDRLANKVSFLRVSPWSYICKRGTGGAVDQLDKLGVTWFYNWGKKKESTPTMDFVPMFWGGNSAKHIQDVSNKAYLNHVLAFNEPDGHDQSNISPESAAKLYPNLLKLGVRVGSPACREGNWKTWLAEFMSICEEKGYHVDFIATHWYDWANWGSTKDPSPKEIENMVARFKRDIDRCYELYKRPIWITEFNANKNRLTEIQISFLEKAIPMLEAHPHVERYAYFQPFGGNGDFLKDDKLTSTAKAYGAIPSTPAVK